MLDTAYKSERLFQIICFQQLFYVIINRLLDCSSEYIFGFIIYNGITFPKG